MPIKRLIERRKETLIRRQQSLPQLRLWVKRLQKQIKQDCKLNKSRQDKCFRTVAEGILKRHAMLSDTSVTALTNKDKRWLLWFEGYDTDNYISNKKERPGILNSMPEGLVIKKR